MDYRPDPTYKWKPSKKVATKSQQIIDHKNNFGGFQVLTCWKWSRYRNFRCRQQKSYQLLSIIVLDPWFSGTLISQNEVSTKPNISKQRTVKQVNNYEIDKVLYKIQGYNNYKVWPSNIGSQPKPMERGIQFKRSVMKLYSCEIFQDIYRR